jgi:hypothetical protein
MNDIKSDYAFDRIAYEKDQFYIAASQLVQTSCDATIPLRFLVVTTGTSAVQFDVVVLREKNCSGHGPSNLYSSEFVEVPDNSSPSNPFLVWARGAFNSKLAKQVLSDQDPVVSPYSFTVDPFKLNFFALRYQIQGISNPPDGYVSCVIAAFRGKSADDANLEGLLGTNVFLPDP